jgi:hypothetical protein
MSEGNSCWNGGQPGVSDTLASALWVVDMMLEFASAGCAGVNLHGGGSGFYTPIAGNLATGFVRRPEYFGMELTKQFLGATLVRSSLACDNNRIRTYAARKAGATLVLAVNKTEQPAAIQTPLRRAHRQWLLTGPAMDAKQDVTLTAERPGSFHNGTLQVPAHSAILIEA